MMGIVAGGNHVHDLFPISSSYHDGCKFLAVVIMFKDCIAVGFLQVQDSLPGNGDQFFLSQSKEVCIGENINCLMKNFIHFGSICNS